MVHAVECLLEVYEGYENSPVVLYDFSSVILIGNNLSYCVSSWFEPGLFLKVPVNILLHSICIKLVKSFLECSAGKCVCNFYRL